MDFSSFISSNNGKIRPSRGRVGHALKCLLAVPLIVQGVTHIEIQSQGLLHDIQVSIDPVTGKPVIKYDDTKQTNLLPFGSFFKIHNFVESTYNERQIVELVRNMSAVNCHAIFNLELGFYPEGYEQIEFKQSGCITRWQANQKLVSHWFDAGQLRCLMQGIYNNHGHYPINSFLSQFDGLSKPAKQKIICDHIGIDTRQGIEAILEKENAIDRLLKTMKDSTREIKPVLLGFMHAQQIAAFFKNQIEGSIQEHSKSSGFTTEDRPFTLDVIFQYGVETKYVNNALELIVCLNNSVLIEGTIENLNNIFNDCAIEHSDNVRILIHIGTPFFLFKGKGKNSVALDANIFNALKEVFKKVSVDWVKIKKKKRIEEANQNKAVNSKREKSDTPSVLPKKSDIEGLKLFAESMKKIQLNMDFKAGSRGWCYILEDNIKLLKSDFAKAEKIISDCRKEGYLPHTFTAEDEARSMQGGDYSINLETPESFVSSIINNMKNQYRNYHPVNLHTFVDYSIVVGVEKIDLIGLFKPVCDKFHIPIFNARGWTDINSRCNLMLYLKDMQQQGKKCVYLYCGDHDPGGLNISNQFKENLRQLKKAVGFLPDFIEVERFGLNSDFIKKEGLSWIENLDTKSGSLADTSHKDHNKNYVQDYIKQFGVRKCEANSLVVRPETGRQLLTDTILKYITESQIDEYNSALAEHQDIVKQLIEQRFKLAA
jgi:DNA topoisomerase VI subunit B